MQKAVPALTSSKSPGTGPSPSVLAARPATLTVVMSIRAHNTIPPRTAMI